MKWFPLSFHVAICLALTGAAPAWSADTAPASTAGAVTVTPPTGYYRWPHGWYPPAPANGYRAPPARRIAPYYGNNAGPALRQPPQPGRGRAWPPGYRGATANPSPGAYPEQTAAYQAELDAMREELQQTKDLLKNAGIALDRAIAGEQEAVAENNLIKAQLDTFMAESDAARKNMADLAAELQAARKKTADLAAELQAARTREAGITGRLAKLQDFTRTTSDERIELRHKISAGERQLAELKAVVRETADERTVLRDQLAERDSQLAVLTAEVQDAAGALLKAQAAAAASQDSYGAAESRHQSCQEQLSRRDVALEREVRDRASALTDAAAERGRLQNELKACKAELAGQQAAVDASRQVRFPAVDGDADGVPDSDDLCPNTRAGITVGPAGCALNAPMALEGVNFLYNSHDLTSESHAILDRVAGILRQHPELRLEVAGHTDTQGDPDYNLWLSQERADSVRNYLEQQGVNGDTLTARGYGSQQPIADNATRAGLAQNRRVELRRMP